MRCANVLSRDILPPHYTGRLVHRGELAASSTTDIRVKMTVDRAGSYALSAWSVDTEVGETPSDNAAPWRVRQQYHRQAHSDDVSCVTIVDASQP